MSNKKILAYSLLILFVFLSSCSNGTTSGPVIETRITGYVINPNIPEDEHDEVYNSTVTVTSNLGTYTSVPSENSNFFDIMGIEHNGSFTITVSVEGFPDYSYSEVVTTEETEILEKTLELDTTEYIYMVGMNLSYILYDLYGNQIDRDIVTFSSNNSFLENASRIYIYHNGSVNFTLNADGYAPRTCSFETTDNYLNLNELKLYRANTPVTTVSGKVKYKSSELPIAGASIVCAYDDSIRTLSDADGYYEIDIPHIEGFSLEVSAETMSSTFSEEIDTSGSEYELDIEVPVDSTYWTTVTGQVFESDGTTRIDGIEVSTGEFSYITGSGTYDNNGEYKGIYVKKGEAHTITFSGEGYDTATYVIDDSNYSDSLTININLNAETLSYPSNFRAENIAQESYTLAWDKVEGAGGYRIMKSSTQTGAYTLDRTITSGNTLSADFSSRSPNTKYFHKIVAYNFNGDTTMSPALTVKTLPPSSVSINGSIRDNDTNSLITDAGLTVSCNTQSATVSGGSYNKTVDTSSTNGLITLQAGGVLGYNNYMWTIDADSTSETHNIKLIPTLGSPVTTTVSGNITDSSTGTVPADIENLTVSVNAHNANVNTSTGYYTVSVTGNMGSLIIMVGGSLSYNTYVRTIAADGATETFDIEL